MEINILQFLLENNNVRIHQNNTMRDLEADEDFRIGGELVVYTIQGAEVYRGTDFDKAVKALNGEDE